MTIAVCIQCGARKMPGAWTPCRSCGFEPSSPEDRAKSILLSDHNIPPERLGEIGAQIAAGCKLRFDDASVQRFAAVIPPPQPPKLFLGVRRSSWIMLSIAIAIGLLGGSCMGVAMFLLHR